MAQDTSTRPAGGVASGVRVLGSDDLSAVAGLLVRRPVHNLFVSSRIRFGGLDPADLGCPIWGWERDGELRALCHAGSNLVPVIDDPDAIDAFATFAGRRRCSSISGESSAVMPLWRRLQELAGSSWSEVREVRARQPLMVIDHEPTVEPDPDLVLADATMMDSYFDAAVRMYTEEVGVSPLDPSPHSYRSYVRTLINCGRAFAVLRDGEVIFKADLGSVTTRCCQIQGVWLDPRYRGAGLAPSMMAAVVQRARMRYPTVSLYVNDFNHAALATYRRTGFRQEGEFATVLY